MEGGLRERKKARTREAIVEAAFRLFDERGFDATTIADIAAAAEIAPRTFFGYFPSKEDVLFADFGEVVEEMSAALEARGGASSFEALGTWLAGYVDRARADTERQRITSRLAATVPSIAARELQLHAVIQERLAQALAEDLGAKPGDVRPAMVAAAAMTAFRTIERQLAEQGPSADFDLRAIAEQVSVFALGGLEALRRAGR